MPVNDERVRVEAQKFDLQLVVRQIFLYTARGERLFNRLNG